jgi:hypothetical protein
MVDMVRIRVLLALAVLIGSQALLACGSGGDREAEEFAAAVRARPEIADVRLHLGDGTISRRPFLSGTVAIRSDTPPERVPAVVARVAGQLPFADITDLTGEIRVSVGSGAPRADRPDEVFVLGFHAPPVPADVEAEAQLWERFTAALPGTALDMDVRPDGSHDRTVRVRTSSDAVPAALRTAFDTLATAERSPTAQARLELRVDGAAEPSYSSGLGLPPEQVRRAMLAVAELRAASPFPASPTNVGWSASNCGPPYLFASVVATPDEVQPPGARAGGAYVEALTAAGVPYVFRATDGGDEPFAEIDKRCPS